MKSTGLRQAEIKQFAALLRGGEPWHRVRASNRSVSPSLVDRWRSDIEALAAESGPSATIPEPISPEEERELLRKWAEDRLPRITPSVKVVTTTRGVRVLGGQRR